jgi:hypothetical protein
MTYRVILDYGPIELTVMIWSDTSNSNTIYESTLKFLEEEGFSVPKDNYPAATITPAPEWDEE